MRAAVESEVRTEPFAREPLESQFKVEDLDMLYASWSKTVRIDRQSLSDWGRELGKWKLKLLRVKERDVWFSQLKTRKEESYRFLTRSSSIWEFEKVNLSRSNQ